ncbi:MAG: ATP synthase F1 subunit gamma [Planctomycetes bacterium]|nr:ATP synthase F1 subunit gamma [Planctomycetota bacterium]
MASAKDIKRKIKSISATKKITRTMEMVAAAKSKKTTRRVEIAAPYNEKLGELLENLCAGENVTHSLMEPEAGQPPRASAGRNALVVVTANRGLCGGYNANVLQAAERWIQAEEAGGRATDVSMIGKKGISRFSFRKQPFCASYTHIGDWPRFEDAEEIAGGLMERFRAGEVDQALVVSTRYHSAGLQRPALTRLLPIARPRPGGLAARRLGAGAGGDWRPRAEDRVVWRPSRKFIFEPDLGTILESLLPFSIIYSLFRLLVEAAASEQIARRMAMKTATDNADDLVRVYKRRYNRQRQAGITQQISEIVGGAEALD